MKLNVNGYEKIFEEFKKHRPDWADRVVEYRPKNSWTIRVTRDDGKQIDYNMQSGSSREVRYIAVNDEDINEDDVRSLFASNLAEIMRVKGFGQTLLAERTGLTSAAISKYLNRKSTPTLTAVIKIARALNCAPEELMD